MIQFRYVPDVLEVFFISLYRPAQINHFVAKNFKPTQFSTVLALPHMEMLPGGSLYTFYFANGYGAHIVESHATPGESVEFCVLDCTEEIPKPDFSTSISHKVQASLTLEEAQRLLQATAELPSHPKVAKAEAWLTKQRF